MIIGGSNQINNSSPSYGQALKVGEPGSLLQSKDSCPLLLDLNSKDDTKASNRSSRNRLLSNETYRGLDRFITGGIEEEQ